MKSNKRYYITLATITLVFLLFIGVLFAYSDKSEIATTCKIVDVEYRNVAPVDCWLDSWNNTYCPLPHSFECDVRVKGLGSLLTQLIINSID